jgi:hypothetical protein
MANQDIKLDGKVLVRGTESTKDVAFYGGRTMKSPRNAGAGFVKQENPFNLTEHIQETAQPLVDASAAAVKPYTVYKAYIEQVGGAIDPTITVFENTTGLTASISRQDAGEYWLDFSGDLAASALPEDGNVFVKSYNVDVVKLWALQFLSASRLYIYDAALSDGGLKMYLEIQVYS